MSKEWTDKEWLDIYKNRSHFAENILEAIMEDATTLEEAKKSAELYFIAVKSNIVR